MENVRDAKSPCMSGNRSFLKTGTTIWEKLGEEMKQIKMITIVGRRPKLSIDFHIYGRHRAKSRIAEQRANKIHRGVKDKAAAELWIIP